MPYEALSRALAYASCFSSLTLFATAMAIAVVNVGKLKPPDACVFAACAIHSADAMSGYSAKGQVHRDVIAALPPNKF